MRSTEGEEPRTTDFGAAQGSAVTGGTTSEGEATPNYGNAASADHTAASTVFDGARDLGEDEGDGGSEEQESPIIGSEVVEGLMSGQFESYMTKLRTESEESLEALRSLLIMGEEDSPSSLANECSADRTSKLAEYKRLWDANPETVRAALVVAAKDDIVVHKDDQVATLLIACLLPVVCPELCSPSIINSDVFFPLLQQTLDPSHPTTNTTSTTTDDSPPSATPTTANTQPQATQCEGAFSESELQNQFLEILGHVEGAPDKATTSLLLVRHCLLVQFFLNSLIILNV
ncbi:hypothetical protein Pelo_16325 [Pelomyxa schiedti]|nr:hypothetical protein Pelo_16325 [Pelomyxa schiedti]